MDASEKGLLPQPQLHREPIEWAHGQQDLQKQDQAKRVAAVLPREPRTAVGLHKPIAQDAEGERQKGVKIASRPSASILTPSPAWFSSERLSSFRGSRRGWRPRSGRRPRPEPGYREDGGPPRVEAVHPELARRLRGVESLAEHGRAAVDHVVVAVETTVIPSVNSARRENIVVEVEELRSLDEALRPHSATREPSRYASTLKRIVL